MTSLAIAGILLFQSANLSQGDQNKLPPEVVATAKFLFEHGLEDPSGGVYREATIQVTDLQTGKPVRIKVHAWQKGTSNRVVAWNGLAYEAVSLGKPVNLEHDVRQGRPRNDGPSFAGRRGYSETSLATNPVQPLGVFLLLGFGRVDLAEFVHAQPQAKVWGESHRAILHYLTIRYERGISAYARFEDASALSDFEVLHKHRQAYLDEWNRLYQTGDAYSEHPLSFLEPLATLIARLKSDAQQPRPRISMERVAAKPQPERIQALIQAMDQIEEQRWSVASGSMTAQSPIVQAILAEGEPILDALIDCLESDPRYTRSVAYGGNFHSGRNPIPVAEVARYAIEQILRVNLTGNPGEAWSSQQIRAYWEAHRGTTAPERWYRNLANDQIGRYAWVEAARSMTGRSEYFPYRQVSKSRRSTAPMHGESLRIGKSPSVNDLLHRRVVELMKPGEALSTSDIWQAQSGAEIAVAHFTWDPKASLESLREACKGITKRSQAKDHGSAVVELLSLGGMIYSLRMELRDPEAAGEYRAQVERVLGRDDDYLTRNLGFLRVLWEYPDAPGISALSQRIFESQGSPWSPSGLVRKVKTHELARMVDQPVLLIPAFRAALAKAILDPTPYGEGKIEKSQNYYHFLYRRANGGSGSMGPIRNVPTSKVGQAIPMRASDYLILSMRSLKGLPPFEIYWSDKQKDQARQEIAKFLTSDRDFSTLLPEHVWSQYR